MLFSLKDPEELHRVSGSSEEDHMGSRLPLRCPSEVFPSSAKQLTAQGAAPRRKDSCSWAPRLPVGSLSLTF